MNSYLQIAAPETGVNQRKSRVAYRSVAMRLGRIQTFYRCASRESRVAQCNANMCGCEEKTKVRPSSVQKAASRWGESEG